MQAEKQHLETIIGKAIEIHKEKEAKKDFIDKFLDFIEGWWSWQNGRRSKVGGYKIMTLLEYRKRIWFGLIRYKVGDHQPVHLDPLRTGYLGHLKINLELWPAKGSKFITMFPHFAFGPLHIFWANHNPHQVTSVVKGARYVLSFSLFTKKFNFVEDDKWLKKVAMHQHKLAYGVKCRFIDKE